MRRLLASVLLVLGLAGGSVAKGNDASGDAPRLNSWRNDAWKAAVAEFSREDAVPDSTRQERLPARRHSSALDHRLRRAYDLLSGAASAARGETPDDLLRLVVVKAKGEADIERDRKHLIEAGYADAFVARFDAAAQFGKLVEGGDGLYAYVFAKKYQTEGGSTARLLASKLLRLAETKAYPARLYEKADEQFASTDAVKRCLGFVTLRRLVDRGHMQAAVELARRYRDGRGMERDDREALHWLLYVSSRLGVTGIEDDLAVLLARMSEQDKREVLKWHIQWRPVCK